MRREICKLWGIIFGRQPRAPFFTNFAHLCVSFRQLFRKTGRKFKSHWCPGKDEDSPEILEGFSFRRRRRRRNEKEVGHFRDQFFPDTKLISWFQIVTLWISWTVTEPLITRLCVLVNGICHSLKANRWVRGDKTEVYEWVKGDQQSWLTWILKNPLLREN